jgi:hypothetical protein
MDKRFIICITIVLFLFAPFSLLASKKNKKVRFELCLTKHFSTSFDPDSMNRANNPVDAYDHEALFLIDEILLRGSGWEAMETRICFDTEMPVAQGKVLSRSFMYEPGDVFPVMQERIFAISRSGIPFRVGVDIPIANNWSVGVDYFQSEKYRFEQTESQDYFSIETLQKLPGQEAGFYWWEMDLQRTYEKSATSSTFSHLGLEAAVRYDLLGDFAKVTLSPEAGVSFSYIKRKFDQEKEFYGYSPTLFPQFVFPGSSLENYRELSDTKILREDSTSKLKTRFFAGFSLHYFPTRILGFSCTARVYSKKLSQEYPTSSVFGEFPFELNVAQFFFSAGITLSFLN